MQTADTNAVRPDFPLLGEPSSGPLLRLELIPAPFHSEMTVANTLDRFMVWSDERGRMLACSRPGSHAKALDPSWKWIIGAVWYRRGHFELCLLDTNTDVFLNEEIVPLSAATQPCIRLRNGARLLLDRFGLEYVVSITAADERERELRDAAEPGRIAMAIHRGLSPPWFEAPWMLTVERLVQALRGPDDVELRVLYVPPQTPEATWEQAPHFLPVLRRSWGKRGAIRDETLLAWPESPRSYERSAYDVRQFFCMADLITMAKLRWIDGVTAHFNITKQAVTSADYQRMCREPSLSDWARGLPAVSGLYPSNASDVSPTEYLANLEEWLGAWRDSVGASQGQ